ncbi:MAG: hypothetical protein ACREFE_20065, partial [Limisphaerales bacterium]
VTLLLAKLNLKFALVAAVVLGIVLIVVIINFAVRHNRGRNALSGLPPAVYQTSNSGDTLPLPKQ